MLEVEERVLIKNEEDLKYIVGRLKEMGATKQGAPHIIDNYYCKNEVQSFSEIEMGEVGSFSLRIRQEDGAGSVNMKLIREEGNHNAWVELESKVEDWHMLHLMFKNLGLKQFIRVEKQRTKMKIGNVSINLEDIKDFGWGIELEMMVEEKDKKKARERLKELLRELEIADRTVDKSITNMLMINQGNF